MIDRHTAPVRRLQALPQLRSPLIGRAREVSELTRRLLQPGVRLLTLTGPGGTGKTCLAITVADELRGAFDGEVLFVDLASVADASQVLPVMGESVGVLGAPTGADLLARLEEALQGRLLLVLDNFEQVMDAAPHVGTILASCPALTVLATSRAPLRIRSEVEYPVSPLDVPRLARPQGVDELAQTPAVALFLERARAVRPDFQIDGFTAPVVAELCVRLDGLPLAIELAAARSKLLSPHALLARLDDRLDILAASTRDQPTRHRTLRQAIDWSYELLSAGPRALFQQLAVFVGGWTLEAAEAVCRAESFASSDVLELMGDLVDNSLVVPQLGTDGRDRYRLLETLRQYALEKLDDGQNAASARERHARYFQGLAQRAERELLGSGARNWLIRLLPERDNLRAALLWSLDAGESQHSARLGTVLWEVLEHALGKPPTGRSIAEPRLAATPPDPLSAREREVAVLIARGYSNRAIAEELVISLRTAETHVERILSKLGFGARAQVGAWAVGHGLVSTDTPG